MTTLAAAQPRRTLTEPTSIDDLGLDRGLLWDLTLKTLFYRGRMSRQELSGEMKLSGSAMEEMMQALSHDNLVSVLGAGGAAGPAGYVYALSQKGMERAEGALLRSGYVGPAPVPLDDYVTQVQAQTLEDVHISREEILRALGPLVLSDQTVSRIGRAASSRRSTLVYGASGNGKTTAVSAIGGVIGGTIRIPYAIEAVGQIVHLFDPSKHEIVPDDPTNGSTLLASRADRRWVRIRRPVIWAGGELTKHSLELVYDESSRVYEAPLQLKANGGTLIIDDFGRQQMPAVQLLNRWITALEGGVDHLTLHTGQTVEAPFDVLVLFSTNLPPEDLADDAFLRRIRYKVEIPNPTADEFRGIFRRECRRIGIAFDENAYAHLLDRWYAGHQRELRGCHPRDIIEAIADAASYERQAPVLTTDTLDEACATYFLSPAHLAAN
jgi:predicted ATPase with chaperone activity